jgi:CRISPR-associated protein Cmr5
MPSLPRTLDQNRAAQAWEDVAEVNRQESEQQKKRYSSLARRMPTLIMTAGLGQALAFLRAKENKKDPDAYAWLYNHVSRWTLRQLRRGEQEWQGMRDWARGFFDLDQADEQTVDQDLDRALLEWVIEPEQGTGVYRQATVETLAFLNWLKRFAEAELPEPDAEDEVE